MCMCIWAEEKKVIEMKACGTLQTLKSICSITKSNGATYLLMSQLTFTNLGKKINLWQCCAYKEGKQ